MTGDLINFVLIILFLACFKKRDSAYSYSLLWFMQSWLAIVFKLIMRNPKPIIYVIEADRDMFWKTDNGTVFSNPNYSTLSTATISLTLVAEYFYRLNAKHGDRNIILTFRGTTTTNDSFVSSDVEENKRNSSRENNKDEEASKLWVRVLFYLLGVLVTFLVGFL